MILVCGGAALPSDWTTFVRIQFFLGLTLGYPFSIREIISLSFWRPR
jgi:hypothetical protein